MPSIFIDLVRLVLVIAGLALLFAWVWGANVGGPVRGARRDLDRPRPRPPERRRLDHQRPAAPVRAAVQARRLARRRRRAGPRRRGQLALRSTSRPRTASSIIPNATLAEGAFTNLSQPAGDHQVIVSSTFAVGDPPDAVLRVLHRVGLDVPVIGIEPQVRAAIDRAPDVHHDDRHPHAGRGRGGHGDVLPLALGTRTAPCRSAPRRRRRHVVDTRGRHRRAAPAGPGAQRAG